MKSKESHIFLDSPIKKGKFESSFLIEKKGLDKMEEKSLHDACDFQCDQKETSMNQNSFIPEWETFTDTSFSKLLSARADSLSQTEDSTVDLVTIAKFEELARATKNFDSTLLIGSGSFGDVFLADLEVGGRLTKVAVKQFKPVFYFRLRRLISI